MAQVVEEDGFTTNPKLSVETTGGVVVHFHDATDFRVEEGALIVLRQVRDDVVTAFAPGAWFSVLAAFAPGAWFCAYGLNTTVTRVPLIE